MANPFAEGYMGLGRNRPPGNEDEKRRKRFLVLGRQWQEQGKIADEDLEDGGIELSEYAKKRIDELKESFRWDQSENAKYGEALVAEGVERRGMTRSGYAWFGPDVSSVMAHDYDDIYNGTDVIAMFEDKDKKRGFPLAIDVTVGEGETLKKMDLSYQDVADFDKLVKFGGSRSIIWVNVPSIDIDDPENGKVMVPHIVLYVPRRIVEEIRDERTSLKRIDDLMKITGQFERAQAIAQLEMKILALLDQISITGRSFTWNNGKSMTREKFVKYLLSDEIFERMDMSRRETVYNARQILFALYREHDLYSSFPPEFSSQLDLYLKSSFSETFPLK